MVFYFNPKKVLFLIGIFLLFTVSITDNHWIALNKLNDHPNDPPLFYWITTTSEDDTEEQTEEGDIFDPLIDNPSDPPEPNPKQPKRWV